MIIFNAGKYITYFQQHKNIFVFFQKKQNNAFSAYFCNQIKKHVNRSKKYI